MLSDHNIVSYTSVQFNQNKGKCGVCGDNWTDKHPRPHEAGGRYGNGVIGRRYTTGQVISVLHK